MNGTLGREAGKSLTNRVEVMDQTRLRHVVGFAMTLLALLVLSFLVTVSSAQAQIHLQIGGSEAEFKAALAREGYDRISTHKLGLSNSSFDACKDGKRWRVRFEWTGRTSRKRIGDCRTMLVESDIRKLLRDRGYRRITIEDRAGKYLAIGCQGSERFRAEVNYYGDITRERRIGKCESELTPADITARLESEGFDRIIFTDRQLPRYQAEACLRGNRVLLQINRRGEIVESNRIGRCRDQVQPDEIAGLMKERGYTRIKVIDDRLPRYIAEGCLDGRRMEVTMNRWGEIANQVFLRPCRKAFTVEQITQSMRQNGYSNITVRKQGREFITRGCRDNRYMEVVLTAYGELLSRGDLGSCDSPRVNELAEILARRGLTDLKFYAEGCRSGSRVRITFDQFANRISRDVVGGC